MKKIWNYLTNGYVNNLYIKDKKLFIAEDSNMNVLEILDINNTNVSKIGSLNMKGVAKDIAIIGNDLFLLAGENYVFKIDISDISNPTYIGRINRISNAIKIIAYKKHLIVSAYYKLYIVGEENTYIFNKPTWIRDMVIVDDEFLLTLGINNRGLHLLHLNSLLQGDLIDYFEQNNYSGHNLALYDNKYISRIYSMVRLQIIWVS